MSTTLDSTSGLPELEPGEGEGSTVGDDEVPTTKSESVTTKNVIIILAAIGAIATFAANWFFYTRSDGRVLETKMDAMQRDSSRMAETLNALAGTMNAVLIQQAKQGELSIRLSQEIDRLDKKEK